MGVFALSTKIGTNLLHICHTAGTMKGTNKNHEAASVRKWGRLFIHKVSVFAIVSNTAPVEGLFGRFLDSPHCHISTLVSLDQDSVAFFSTSRDFPHMTESIRYYMGYFYFRSPVLPGAYAFIIPIRRHCDAAQKQLFITHCFLCSTMYFVCGRRVDHTKEFVLHTHFRNYA